MPSTNNYKHDTNYHGLIGLFLFRSVQPFVSRHVTMPKLPRSYLRLVPSCCVCLCANLLRGPSPTKQGPNTLICDNESAIHVAENPVEHIHTKHIDIWYHFLRDHSQRRDIVIDHVSTHKQ
jgi:hypothetical protein